jgi:hypothetical protein
MRLLKSDACIKARLEEKGQESYKTKLIRSTEHKILLLRQLEDHYNIGRLELDFKNNEFKPMDEGTFKSIKYVYDTKKESPTNQKELKQLYVFMLKQLDGGPLNLSTWGRGLLPPHGIK